jgi:hypothetical protein
MNRASLNTNYRKVRRGQRCITAVALAFMCASCVAMQRMETAVITEADGLPCFSIPQKWETRNGIPLYAITVHEPKSADWKSMPVQYWGMGIEPPGNSVLLRPQGCIRYGEKPASATSEMDPAKPLEPYHVYAVTLNARPEGSSVAYYKAEFCLKPSAGGKMIVQQVSIKQSDLNRYAVCAKP